MRQRDGHSYTSFSLTLILSFALSPFALLSLPVFMRGNSTNTSSCAGFRQTLAS
jgi:hypothetical protein